MMIDYMNGPCMFAEFPLMRDIFPGNMFANERNIDFHANKRPCYRNNYGNKYTHKRANHSHKDTSIRYTIESVGDTGYELKLYKKIPSGMLEAAVKKTANELVDKLYAPNYHVVEDIFGRQYYVEEEMDPQQLRNKVFSSIDMNDIKKKLARKLFHDYGVELNHRGDEVTINSTNDGIHQEFNFEKELDDIKIKSCNAVDDETVMLCVELKEHKEPVRAPVPRTIEIDFNLVPLTYKEEDSVTTEPEVTHPDEEEDNEVDDEEIDEHLGVLDDDFMMDPEEQYESSAESSIASESEPESESDSEVDQKTTITKVYSPILENVEDEEIDRYKKAFEHSPKGYALVEDL